MLTCVNERLQLSRRGRWLGIGLASANMRQEYHFSLCVELLLIDWVNGDDFGPIPTNLVRASSLCSMSIDGQAAIKTMFCSYIVKSVTGVVHTDRVKFDADSTAISDPRKWRRR